MKPVVARHTRPPGEGDWLPGVALGPAGVRRFRLYRPPDLQRGERLPLLVMLHGCGQDAPSFAKSTRMNSLAARERFLVLYPEQDRLANPQGCWNWFDKASGRAEGEASLVMKAIDQVCLLHPADPSRVAVAGLSAGASLAALLATMYPARFQAVVMHSGIAPGAGKALASAKAAGRPPLLVIHGDADLLVAPQHGLAAAKAWAATGGANEGPVRRVQRGQRHPSAVTDFKRRGHLAATLVAVARLGHAWSGGAASQAFSDPKGPDASRMLWSFVERCFRDRAGAGKQKPAA
ncbi:MAG: prolyl oligopeptidase family serine peptidase [Vitreoscilla sp.]|nr:prolyl oligopeptidase family serine peptidase [Vitreoscilla sp.]